MLKRSRFIRKVLTGIFFCSTILIIDGCKKEDPAPEPEPTPAPVPSPLPVVTTNTITAITESSAACGGEVTSEGNSILLNVGVCWDTQPNPTILRPHTNDGAGVGKYISKIENLESNTTYYVRAYASNMSGTAYGNEISFKTKAKWTKVFSSIGMWDIVTRMLATEDKLFVNVAGSGMYTSTDGGTWNSLSAFPDSYVSNLVKEGGYLFAGTDSKGILKSPDNGATWTDLHNNSFVYLNAMAVKGPTLFAHFDNLMRRSDNIGVSWNTLNNAPVGLPCTAIIISGNSVFAAFATGGIHRSTDLGTSWTALNSGLPSGVTVNEFFLHESKLFAATQSGIFMSNNNGDSWTSLNSGLTAIPNVNSITRHNNVLYISVYNDSDGIWESTNEGGSWFKKTAGLPAGTKTAALVAYKDFLYAGTQKGEIYRFQLK